MRMFWTYLGLLLGKWAEFLRGSIPGFFVAGLSYLVTPQIAWWWWLATSLGIGLFWAGYCTWRDEREQVVARAGSPDVPQLVAFFNPADPMCVDFDGSMQTRIRIGIRNESKTATARRVRATLRRSDPEVRNRGESLVDRAFELHSQDGSEVDVFPGSVEYVDLVKHFRLSGSSLRVGPGLFFSLSGLNHFGIAAAKIRFDIAVASEAGQADGLTLEVESPDQGREGQEQGPIVRQVRRETSFRLSSFEGD